MKKLKELLEAQHYNTKIRSVDSNIGSRKIRLGIQESKKMIDNMLNKDHESPNPKSDSDRKLLKECGELASHITERLKLIKDSNKRN